MIHVKRSTALADAYYTTRGTRRDDVVVRTAGGEVVRTGALGTSVASIVGTVVGGIAGVVGGLVLASSVEASLPLTVAIVAAMTIPVAYIGHGIGSGV